MLEKANQLIRKAEELKAKMSATMRYRSDSVVSIDEPALQLGLNGEAVMEETVLEMLQTNNVEELRKIDADALALATTAKTYALHEACEHGAFDAVKFLVGELAHDVDARDEQRWTPLHYAAAFGGAPELVHYLLAAGADPAAEDEDGATPLETYLDENESDDPTALLLRSVAEHVEAAEGRDYETWAQAHARDETYGAYVADVLGARRDAPRVPPAPRERDAPARRRQPRRVARSLPPRRPRRPRRRRHRPVLPRLKGGTPPGSRARYPPGIVAADPAFVSARGGGARRS